MSSIGWVRSLANTLATGLFLRSQHYLYESPLDLSRSDWQPTPPEGVIYRFIDQENVGLAEKWLGTGEIWRFRRFLNRGDLGVYALANGEVVHYDWVALNLPGYGWARAHDPIELGDALLHRGYTRQDHRRRGVGSYAVVILLAFLRERYLERGLRRACALVLTDNMAPQTTLGKLGFRKVQQVGLVRLMGTLFIYRIRPITPAGAGGLKVRFKVPEILWDPRLPIARTIDNIGTKPEHEDAHAAISDRV